ncbi:hypothetical protein MKP05_18245 [Halomonas sp. EGI 63088]|uniref:Uncharacterized protein n=1 Tax=Halomonas flagellata TaxID=2920385 RepID=A0ABS9RYW8_9GAMM|nr:hypothetical protein [Halomonas flagellata]MCH4565042.1 hypothetical protein [Halomonas flagellata]
MTDVELLQFSPLFDPQWYQERYPDVQALDLTPEQHFLKYGWWLGRNPGPQFSVPAYLDKYPDIRKARVNPLLHFIEQGEEEGRQAQPVSEPGAAVAAPLASLPADTPPEPPADAVPADPAQRTERQLAHTQQLLEHYYNRSRELEFRLQGL